jgi:hypothetical protein
MAKQDPYARLSKAEQVAIVEAQAAGKLQELHGLDVDLAQLDAVAKGSRDDAWKMAHGQVTKQRDEARRLASALETKANALRGKPLSSRERAGRDGAIARLETERLTELIRSWAEARLQHEVLAEAGDKSAPHKDAIAGIDRAIAAAETKISQLAK